MPPEWQHDGFTLSTDPARLDVSAIHAFLSASYWAKGIPRDVLEEFRGRGLSRFLMRCVLEHPELQGFRRSFLVTRDAHGRCAKFGFTPLAAPERWMEKWTPDVYAQASKPA